MTTGRGSKSFPPRMRFYGLFAALLLCGVGVFAPAASWAQGTLTVRVISRAVGSPPIAGARVDLSSETERPKQQNTSSDGVATFTKLAEGVYTIGVTAVGFQPLKVRVPATVSTDKNTQVTIAIAEKAATEVNVSRAREIVERYNTADYTRRDRRFWENIPVGVGNRQSVNRILRSVPGFVGDSLDQVHARGESPLTNATYVDGFLLPMRAALPPSSAFIVPDVVSVIDVKTGGYAPEYGMASGSVTDLVLRPTPFYTTGDVAFKVGEFNTAENYITFGTSAAGVQAQKAARRRNGGKAVPVSDLPAPTTTGKNVGFLVNVSQRFSDYGQETPQIGSKTANNALSSEILFAKADVQVNPLTTITGIINYQTSDTFVPQRDGSLGGQAGIITPGSGYGGFVPLASGLRPQADLGDALEQKNNNNVNFIQIKRTLKNGGRSTLAFGFARSKQDLSRAGGPINPTSVLPADNSVEFLPTVNNTYDQLAFQGDIALGTKPNPRRTDSHAFKAGFVYHDLSGSEGIQLIPQSQLALNALYTAEPTLVPLGNATGNADKLGNREYLLTPNVFAASPILVVKREGYYGGAYLQDTWRVRPPLTINYGLRGDFYSMGTKFSTANTAYGKDDVSASELSPRFNLAFTLPQNAKLRLLRVLASQPTIIRTSYNRMFVSPNLAQGDLIPNQPARGPIPGVGGSGGTTVGSPVVPQKTDLYDIGVERQLDSNKVVKFTYYHKDIKNLLSSQQFLPYLQAGVVSTQNLGDAVVDASEISFELLPPPVGEAGAHAYFTYTNGTAQPNSRFERSNIGQFTGFQALEWEQTDTITAGLAYSFAGGASAGLNAYYGSGLFSSGLRVLQANTRVNDRQTINEVNLRLSSGQRFVRNLLGVELEVENLFGSRSRYNYQSALTGTRYQQARRVLFQLNARF